MSWTWSDVCWVVQGENLTPHLASVRYMAIIPAVYFGAKLESYTVAEGPEHFLDRVDARLIILNKAFDDTLPRLAEAAKERGIKVASAFADWHFDERHNLDLARLSDIMIVQTNVIAREVEKQFGHAPVVIEEAYEGKKRPPKFAPRDPLRMVWYGHKVNLDTIAGMWPAIGAMAGRRFIIEFVTNAGYEELVGLLNSLPTPMSDIVVRYSPWSERNQEKALGWADMVLIPSLDRPDKHVKGHNRLVTAIRAGRLALAYPIAPYRELADYCWLGENFAEGIDWAIANRKEVLSRIGKGQRYIESRFSPKSVAVKWEQLVIDLLGAEADDGTTS